MARRARVTTDRHPSPAAGPVITRHLLEELHPSLRSEAIARTASHTPDGRPDATLIRVTGAGAYEITPQKRV